MRFKRKLGLLVTILLASLTLSACESDIKSNLSQTNYKKPVIIASYDFDGQKISQIKSQHATIKSDPKMVTSDPAVLDIQYGDNKTVHTGSSLIAYSGLTNYADAYQNYLAKTDLDTDEAQNKSQPSVGKFYNYYSKMLSQDKYQDQTLVLVTSQDGSIIGAFIGSKVTIHSGSTDVNKIYIDKHQLLVYKSHFSTYPISVLPSMAQNKKAPKHNNQDPVKTVDDSSLTSSNSKSKK